ncbi:MAG TPA: hypothetical protein VIM55_16395 [Mucilaginibacter sp.]
MKKVSLSMLAILFAASSVIANVPASPKKAKVKQTTCTSCPKGQKCTPATCSSPESCCK